MSGRPFSKAQRGAMLLFVACLAAIGISNGRPPSLDLSIGKGTASVAFEAAFMRVAFEYGQ